MQIPRHLESALKAHIQQKEITLLIGPRQAGKTTLLRKIAVELEKKGERCLFFNLDIDSDAQHFESQERFVNRIEALSGGARAIVFIDEVQRISNAGLFLKGIYDRELPHKWIATGSGSLELKEKIAESLAGRKRIFQLFPVSLQEFLCYKLHATTDQLPQLLISDRSKADYLLLEYMQYGAYPNVVINPDIEEKRSIIAEIFQSAVERDIQLLLNIEKSKSLLTLLQLVAHRIGRLISYQDLANQSNLTVPTLKNYLWYCQKTFIIEEVLPFFTNKEKELVKSPQYYFVDSGIANLLSNSHNLGFQSPEFGYAFQQLVYHLLKTHASTLDGIKYWRTQNQAEVDFVLTRGSSILPVEVKSAPLNSPKIGKSMHSFIETYNPPQAWIVNRSYEGSIQVQNTSVHFIPWYQLVVVK